jgi:hypothetical protein
VTHRLSLSETAEAWFFAPENKDAVVAVAEWIDQLCEDPASKKGTSSRVKVGTEDPLFSFVDGAGSHSTGLVSVTYSVSDDPPVVRIHKVVCGRDVPMM